MGKLSCSQDPTQDTKILFNFNIWVEYGLSLDHTGQTKLYKPQHAAVLRVDFVILDESFKVHLCLLKCP
jgi:hypothetical protein